MTRHRARWIAAWLACGLALPTQLAAADRHIEFDTDEGTWLSLDLSPDGRTILFDLLGDLYTVSASGGDARRLTSGPAFDSQPVYSPDGRQIAWLSDASGAESIWVAQADGSQARRVSPDDGDPVLVSPEWSADGKTIFVSQFRADLNAFELWRFDVATQTRRPRGAHPGHGRTAALELDQLAGCTTVRGWTLSLLRLAQRRVRFRPVAGVDDPTPRPRQQPRRDAGLGTAQPAHRPGDRHGDAARDCTGRSHARLRRSRTWTHGSAAARSRHACRPLARIPDATGRVDGVGDARPAAALRFQRGFALALPERRRPHRADRPRHRHEDDATVHGARRHDAAAARTHVDTPAGRTGPRAPDPGAGTIARRTTARILGAGARLRDAARAATRGRGDSRARKTRSFSRRGRATGDSLRT